MYRAISHIISRRYMLCLRSAAEIQIKSVTNYSSPSKDLNPKHTDTCPEQLSPPPPPKDDKLFWGALAVMAVAGGFTYYAKQEPEVRDWLTLHAPWFDDLIAVLYEENQTYGEFAEQCITDMKKYIYNFVDDKPPCSLDGDLKPMQAVESENLLNKQLTKSNDKDNNMKPGGVPPPVMSINICEVEECVKDLADTVLANYYSATAACAYYNKLVDEGMVNFSMPLLKEINDARTERDDIIHQSLDNIDDASKGLDDLARYLECGVQAPKQSINAVKGLFTDFQDKITASRMQYQWENDKSAAFDDHVARVEELVTKYTDEMETLFSGLKYDSKKLSFLGSPDLLLYHTYRYATKLQNELIDASANMTDRINRGLATLSQDENDVKARNALIKAEYQKKKLEMYKGLQKRCENQLANNDKTLKEALKKQHERHEESLCLKVLQKEKELEAKIEKMIKEEVAVEKRILKHHLDEMAMKLKVAEGKLNVRLKAERETRRSQELWAAGASLLEATKKGDPIVKVDKELKAIEKASGGDDKLVKIVLKAIPESVRTNGLVPESVLKERYHRMEKAALRVALVEQDGGPLTVFILSWLQSMMLFMKLSCIPQAEYDKPPLEPSKDLDTFDLLRRARFWVEHGNLAVALRYVSALEGASRGAASTWFEAAQGYLETRQAAEAIVAHAAALGLRYI